MNRLLLAPLLFAYTSTVGYASNVISLKQAIAAHKVIVSARGTGGYMGRCLNLNMVNLTCDPLTVSIDPALIFKPADTGYQNLVIVGDENVVLQPSHPTDVTLQTFCGKSYAACPATGIPFDLWTQGDSIMIKTVQFIKANKFYDHLGQSAVWTLTNNKCISTIYDPSNADNSKKFIDFEAAIRRQPVPDYFSYYKIDTSRTSSTCVATDGKQYVDLTYKEGRHRHVYIVVLDEHGVPYNKKEIVEDIKNGDHTVTIQFDGKKDKLGTYAVLLRNDNNDILGKKMVRVGADWCN